MNHDQDCPCATDSVPHGAGCADCSCVKNICPTCEGDVKGEIVDGKCRACQLGVIPDWMKPKDTEKRVDAPEYVCQECQYRGMKERHPKLGVHPIEWCEVVEKPKCPTCGWPEGEPGECSQCES